MIVFIIIVTFLIILFFSIKHKHQTLNEDHKSLEKDKTRLFRSIKNVDDKIKELERIIESHMKDVPREDVELLENIIEEWAEIQKNNHLDDRSWVRNPNKLNK